MSGIITANPGGDVIRSAAVDLYSKKIAVTSEYVALPASRVFTLTCNSDKAVKVIDLQDTKKIVLLEGHERGVRRAIWHPSGTLLVRLNHKFGEFLLIFGNFVFC